MEALIKIDKNAALKAGIDNEGVKKITFNPADLTQEQRDELAQSSTHWSQDTPHFNHLHEINFRRTKETSPVSEANLDTMKQLLDERIACREEKRKKAKQEDLELIAEFLTSKEKLFVIGSSLRSDFKWSWSYSFKDIENVAVRTNHKEALKKIKSVKALADKASKDARHEHQTKEAAQKILNAKVRAKREAKEAAAEAEAAKLLKAQDKQIAKWVEEKGTDSQKARLALALLPREEIIDAIRDEAYTPRTLIPNATMQSQGFERYEKLKTSDICTCDYDSCDCSYDVYAKSSATPEEFEELQEIKKLMPNATVELREHKGESDECEETVYRPGIMVRITVGAFDFSREYAA